MDAAHDGDTIRIAPGTGGGIFTPGFPALLTDSEVAHNVSDQCAGC